jgi:hypothetical protein
LVPCGFLPSRSLLSRELAVDRFSRPHPAKWRSVDAAHACRCARRISRGEDTYKSVTAIVYVGMWVREKGRDIAALRLAEGPGRWVHNSAFGISPGGNVSRRVNPRLRRTSAEAGRQRASARRPAEWPATPARPLRSPAGSILRSGSIRPR